MSAQTQHEGRCPRCGRSGAARTPCVDDACARLGVYRLPRPFGEEPTDDPAIGRMFDAWLVLDRLGSGAMGAVYLAEQQPVGLRGALKLVSRSTAVPADDARFAREASALARLSHPHIVRLMAYGVARQLPYLVMEYVRGGRTLRDVLPELDLAERRGVLVQITHALEAAHAEGVVHRDLKPDNVMVQAVAGEARFARLVDFGLAKFTDDGDRSTIAAGSPRYMAPEQATRRAIGPWTDLYALGVMACELLAHHLPFGDGGVQAVLLRKVDPGHDPLADLERPLPPTLSDFLRRAMALDPGDRFTDAAAMRAALPPLDELPDAALLARTAALDGGALDGAALESTGSPSDSAPEGRRWPAWAGAGLALAAGIAAVALVGADGEAPGLPDLGVPTAPLVAPPPPVAAVDAAPIPDAATPDTTPEAIPDAAAAPPADAAPEARRPRRPAPPRPSARAGVAPKPAPEAAPAGSSVGTRFDMDDIWKKEKP